MIESVKQHLKLSSKEISCMVEDFRDAGARLNLTFWVKDVKTDKLQDTKSNIMVEIIKKFKSHKINISQPQ
jgi:small-conductance mechanosensitive channel